MKRYETLDALRGVAALAVIVFHLRAFGLGADFAPHAYLAVDFFFVLSGFVIAHAYGEALAGPMPWLEFVRRRVVRLAPLAFLGAVFGLAVLLAKWRLFPGREGALDDILLSGVLNLFLLPSLFSGATYDHAMFPGDGPLWSLFFEMAINLTWAGVAARCGRRPLVLIVVASGACLTALATVHGSTRMGVEPQTFWGGAARASFGFTLGVLLFRVQGRLPALHAGWGAVAAASALVIAFCAPLLITFSRPQALAWDLCWILAGFPMLVVFGAAQSTSGRIGRLLGEISYPVYVLHWPCLAIISGARQRIFRTADPVIFYSSAVLGIVALGWIVLKLYDEPVRRWLGRATYRRPVANGAREVPNSS